MYLALLRPLAADTEPDIQMLVVLVDQVVEAEALLLLLLGAQALRVKDMQAVMVQQQPMLLEVEVEALVVLVL